MDSLNENYLKGLIKASQIYFEKNTSLDEEMEINWSFLRNGKEMNVICEFTAAINYIEIINDDMTENGVGEEIYNDKDSFIIHESQHEEHFVDYTNSILERLSKIKLS